MKSEFSDVTHHQVKKKKNIENLYDLYSLKYLCDINESLEYIF